MLKQKLEANIRSTCTRQERGGGEEGRQREEGELTNWESMRFFFENSEPPPSGITL